MSVSMGLSGPRPYVCVLRTKKSELGALANLDLATTRRVLPLLEMVLPEPRVPEDEDEFPIDLKLAQSASEICRGWSRQQPILVDAGRLPDGKRTRKGEHPLPFFVNQLTVRKRTPVPVLSLNADGAMVEAVAAVVAKCNCRCALRINSPADDVASQVVFRLAAICKVLRLRPSNVDLIVDIGRAPGGERASAVQDRTAGLLQALPDPNRWRSLTLLCGAFPPSLAPFEQDQISEELRSDLRFFYSVQGSDSKLPRVPGYGDYCLTSPTMKEQQGGGGHTTPSLVYTTGDRWKIIRGHQRIKGQESQYPELARRVTSLPEFRGATASKGEAYIANVAGELFEKSGSAWMWRKAQTIQHVCFVAKQVGRTA